MERRSTVPFHGTVWNGNDFACRKNGGKPWFIYPFHWNAKVERPCKKRARSTLFFKGVPHWNDGTMESANDRHP